MSHDHKIQFINVLIERLKSEKEPNGELYHVRIPELVEVLILEAFVCTSIGLLARWEFKIVKLQTWKF